MALKFSLVKDICAIPARTEEGKDRRQRAYMTARQQSQSSFLLMSLVRARANTEGLPTIVLKRALSTAAQGLGPKILMISVLRSLYESLEVNSASCISKYDLTSSSTCLGNIVERIWNFVYCFFAPAAAMEISSFLKTNLRSLSSQLTLATA